MCDPLLTIRNHHTPGCGDPPSIVGDDRNVYIGCFENSYREQWIFMFNHDTGDALLRGGDVGWDSEYHVVDGVVPGLILNAEEQLWLRSCWAAVTAGH